MASERSYRLALKAIKRVGKERQGDNESAYLDAYERMIEIASDALSGTTDDVLDLVTLSHTAEARRDALDALRGDKNSIDEAEAAEIISDSLDDLAKLAGKFWRLQIELAERRGADYLQRPPALTINLALPDRGLCGNGRAAKQGRSALVAAARKAAMLEGTRAHRIAIGGADIVYPLFPHHKVAIVVTVKRDPLWSRTKLDDDNLQRGLKAAIDGLQDAFIVATDRQFFFEGPVRWEKGQPLRGGVTLQLYPTGQEVSA